MRRIFLFLFILINYLSICAQQELALVNTTYSYNYAEDVSYYGNFNSKFINFGNYFYFIGNDPGHGNELWRSDGTAAGTGLFYDVNAGAGNGLTYLYAQTIGHDGGESVYNDYSPLISAGHYLYFIGYDSIHGFQIWNTDGTTAGTAILKDILPGPTPADFYQLNLVMAGYNNISWIAYGDDLIFYAADTVNSNYLWITEGTRENTKPIKANFSKGFICNLNTAIKLDSNIIFSAFDSINGNAIWRTNGSDTGTVMMISTKSLVNDFFIYDHYAYFADIDTVLVTDSNTNTVNRELNLNIYKMRGLGPDTTLIKSVNVHSSDYLPNVTFIQQGCNLLFTVPEIDGSYNLYELSAPDTNLNLVRNFPNEHNTNSYSKVLITPMGTNFFILSLGDSSWLYNGLNGISLFTDGLGNLLNPSSSVQAGKNLYFYQQSNSQGNYPLVLWKTDGTKTVKLDSNLNQASILAKQGNLLLIDTTNDSLSQDYYYITYIHNHILKYDLPPEDTVNIADTNCFSIPNANIIAGGYVIIYPNPGSNQMYFIADTSLQIDRIILSDLLGKKIIDVAYTVTTNYISTSQLTNGMYFVSFYYNGHKVAAQRWVKM